MECDRFFFKEQMDDGLFDLEFVPSSDQAADVLTKGLPNPLLFRAFSKLSMDTSISRLRGGGGVSDIVISLSSID